MKVINIEGFGGRNRFNPPSISDNECTTTSRNIIASGGALTKGISFTEIGGSMTGTAAYLDRIYNTYLAASGENRIVMVLASAGVEATGSSLATGGLWYTDDLTTVTPIGYVTGSVSVSGASLISATGNGTIWSSNVQAGDYFRVNSTAGSWFKISSVEDNTHLTLASAVPVAVATGAAYTVLKQLSLNYPAAMGVLNGNLFVSDWKNKVQQYDGTQCVDATAFQRVRYMVQHKGYMFGLRTTTAESRLYWSAINDATTWPATNFVDIDKQANGNGLGLYSYGNELIVFKTHGIYKIIGEVFDPSNPTYSVIPIGVPSAFQFPQNGSYGICAHNGVLFFWNWDGLYTYTHGAPIITKFSEYLDAGNSLANTLLSGTHVDALKRNSTANVWAASYRGQLYLLHKTIISGGSGESGLTIIDHNGNAWRFYSNSDVGFPMHGLVPTGINSAPTRLLCGMGKLAATQSAHLVNLDTEATLQFYNTSGANVAIDSLWQSKQFNIGYGTFSRLIVFLEKQTAGNLTVGWRIDGGVATTKAVDMTVGRGTILRHVIDINQKGTTIQIELSNGTVGQTFRVYGIQIFHDPDSQARIV